MVCSAPLFTYVHINDIAFRDEFAARIQVARGGGSSVGDEQEVLPIVLESSASKPHSVRRQM